MAGEQDHRIRYRRGAEAMTMRECRRPSPTGIAKEPANLDTAGTIHVRELAIPLSTLVSPAFREFYLQHVSRFSALDFDVPAPNAAKSEWDEFDRAQDGWNLELLAAARKRYAVCITHTALAGVPAAIVTPDTGVPAANAHRVLINLRAGGFLGNRGLLFGQLESIPVAALGSFRVITLDYRQAPFHSYPAATIDVQSVYQRLLQDYRPEAIGIFGSSAGGLLAAQSVAWLAAKRLPRPGAVGVLSMSLSPPREAKDQFHSAGDSAAWYAAWGLRLKKHEALRRIPSYMANACTKDPLAWPGASDAVLAEFPPALFLVGTREQFMSTAIVDHARMLGLGVDATLYVMEAACHVAHVTAVDTPEAHDANMAIARFFDKHLAPT